MTWSSPGEGAAQQLRRRGGQRGEQGHGPGKGRLLLRGHPARPEVGQVVGEKEDKGGKADRTEGDKSLFRADRAEGDDLQPLLVGDDHRFAPVQVGQDGLGGRSADDRQVMEKGPRLAVAGGDDRRISGSGRLRIVRYGSAGSAQTRELQCMPAMTRASVAVRSSSRFQTSSSSRPQTRGASARPASFSRRAYFSPAPSFQVPAQQFLPGWAIPLRPGRGCGSISPWAARKAARSRGLIARASSAAAGLAEKALRQVVVHGGEAVGGIHDPFLVVDPFPGRRRSWAVVGMPVTALYRPWRIPPGRRRRR